VQQLVIHVPESVTLSGVEKVHSKWKECLEVSTIAHNSQCDG
jgi:hypothetical protein